jgi:predicted RNase H-like HicB family nuclease
MFGITRCNKPGEKLEELKVNITDAIQLMLASIYEEAHEKKKMEIEVSV